MTRARPVKPRLDLGRERPPHHPRRNLRQAEDDASRMLDRVTQQHHQNRLTEAELERIRKGIE